MRVFPPEQFHYWVILVEKPFSTKLERHARHPTAGRCVLAALGSCRPGTSSDWTGQQQGDGVILILFSGFSGASIDGTSRKQTGAKDHTTHLNLRFHFSDGFLEVFDFRLVQAQRGDFGALDSAQLLAEFARNRGKSPSYVVRVLLRQLEFMINVSLVFKRNRNPSAQVVKKYIRSVEKK